MPVHDARAAHPIDPPHDQLGLRDPGLVYRGDGPGAVPDRAPLLGDPANGQAALVGEADDRQVERLAQVGQPGDRQGSLDRHGGAAERVGGDHADRVAVQAGQRGHRRAAVLGVPQHRAAVEYRVQDLVQPVGRARIARDRGGERLFPAAGRVVAGQHRRQLVHAARQIGQEPPGQRERGVLGVGEPLDGAVAAVHLRAAERFLGQVLAGAAAHYRWPGREQLAEILDQDGQMRHNEPPGAKAHRGAQAQGDYRDDRQVVDHGVPGGVDRHVGVPGVLGHLDAAAAAGPVQQADHGQPHLVGVLLGEDLLGVDGRVAGAAPDGEVVGADQHRAAADARGSGHEVGGQHRDQAALGVVVGEPGQGTDLGEAARVGQPLDALPDGEPAGGPLPCDLLRAAHGLGRRTPPADLLDLGCPVRRGLRLAFCAQFMASLAGGPARRTRPSVDDRLEPVRPRLSGRMGECPVMRRATITTPAGQRNCWPPRPPSGNRCGPR